MSWSPRTRTRPQVPSGTLPSFKCSPSKVPRARSDLNPLSTHVLVRLLLDCPLTTGAPPGLGGLYCSCSGRGLTFSSLTCTPSGALHSSPLLPPEPSPRPRLSVKALRGWHLSSPGAWPRTVKMLRDVFVPRPHVSGRCVNGPQTAQGNSCASGLVEWAAPLREERAGAAAVACRSSLRASRRTSARLACSSWRHDWTGCQK